MRTRRCGILAASLYALACLTGAKRAPASDWPQFMRDSAHTGDAADEALQLPLGLVAQVKLDDAVLTSPAVVGGLAYVVDQMGTAYCVDPQAGKIVWKVSPDGALAMGSNTSSPCVVKGRVYYGTTAGNVHILDAKDGKVIKSLKLGWPIVSALAYANDSIYFQALDGVIRCLDLDGKEKWKWEHYKRYVEPPEITKKEARGHPGGWDRAYHGGGEVAVSGSKVVASVGLDVLCLEDKGKDAELAWCRRSPGFRDSGAAPMSSSISGEYVYTAFMGGDGMLGFACFALKDGTNPLGYLNGLPFPWSTPAVRGSMVAFRYEDNRIILYDCQAKKGVTSCTAPSPSISSPALAKNHCVLTTFGGEVVVFEINPKPGSQPFLIKTPHGKAIGSSPALSAGCVCFGCDDGYFYAYGPGGTLQPRKEERLTLCEPISKVVSATGKVYEWNSVRGNLANTGFVDDPMLKPPLRLRWALRDFGHFKDPCAATAEGDVISVTLQRMVSCLEQATGRLRWRVRVDLGFGERYGVSSAGLLVAAGRVYFPVPGPTEPGRRDGKLLCLDLKDGHTLWSADIGAKFVFSRAYPLLAGGKVVFSSLKKGTLPVGVVEAWDPETGKSAWHVELNVPSSAGANVEGCAAEDTVYFTAGAEDAGLKPENGHPRGQTVAIDAKTGMVLWKNDDVFLDIAGSYPVLAGDRLLLPMRPTGLKCVSAKDGKLLWTGIGRDSRYSVGPDFLVGRSYGGYGGKFGLEDGKAYPGFKGQLGSDSHACSSVALTAQYSFASGVCGLSVRDVQTGALLWSSLGFAPRGCVGVALANGRVFWPSGCSGMVFCWEPGEKN